MGGGGHGGCAACEPWEQLWPWQGCWRREPLGTPVWSGRRTGHAGGSRWRLALPTVSVSGHGEVNVPPDTASVSIGIDVIQPTLAEAQEQATAQATALIEALKAAGIADEDIQTAYFSVNILRDYDAVAAAGAR